MVGDRGGDRRCRRKKKSDVSDESRDTDGKWTAGGGGSASATPTDVSKTPKVFKEAFDKAFADSPFRDHVTHYSEEQLKGMKLFVAEGGKAGIAVHDHGDGRIEATALFNQGGAKGAGALLLAHSIKTAGVNYLECYGENLRKFYESSGFKVKSSAPFNEKYAAPSWNYEKFGRPNYYTLSLEK
jgi:hypothetical protein